MSGDDNGTLSPGQSFTITVSDDISNANGNGPTTAPYGWCGPMQNSVASGWFSVGPLGSREGGQRQDLTVSCTPVTDSTGTWHYRGSMTLTVPDDTGPSMWVSVAVEEYIPMAALGATAKYDYNFNKTYTIVSPSTTTAGTAATTSAATSTASPATTATTTEATTTETTRTQATTTVETTTGAPTPTTTSPTTTTTPAEPKPKPASSPPRIEAPAKVTVRRTRAFVLTVRSSARSSQTLCWAWRSSARRTCAPGRGAWRVRLRAVAGRLEVELEEHGQIVARKTIVVELAG